MLNQGKKTYDLNMVGHLIKAKTKYDIAYCLSALNFEKYMHLELYSDHLKKALIVEKKEIFLKGVNIETGCAK